MFELPEAEKIACACMDFVFGGCRLWGWCVWVYVGGMQKVSAKSDDWGSPKCLIHTSNNCSGLLSFHNFVSVARGRADSMCLNGFCLWWLRVVGLVCLLVACKFSAKSDDWVSQTCWINISRKVPSFLELSQFVGVA